MRPLAASGRSAASCRPTFSGAAPASLSRSHAALQSGASCLDLRTALLVPSPSTDPADPVPSVHTPTYLLVISRSKSAYTTDLFASIKPKLLRHKTLRPLVLARCPNSPPIHVSNTAAAQNLSAPDSRFQEAQDSTFFETRRPLSPHHLPLGPSKSIPPVPSILQVAPGRAPTLRRPHWTVSTGSLLADCHPSIPDPGSASEPSGHSAPPGGSPRVRASPGR